MNSLSNDAKLITNILLNTNHDLRGVLLKRVATKLSKHQNNFTAKIIQKAGETYDYQWDKD